MKVPRRDWKNRRLLEGSRERGQVVYSVILALSVAGFGGLGFLMGTGVPEPQERSFTIHARQYAYEPRVIRVNRGDTVTLKFAALDVVHGFYLEGYDIDVEIAPGEKTVELHKPSRPDLSTKVEEVVFVADKEGKFRYRCSKTCGFMHPFMLGELIVEPNRLLPTSIGLALGILFGGILVFDLERRPK